jgi:membrane-associated phospholipid phosphatase
MAMYVVFGCIVGIGCTWASFKALGKVETQTMKELCRWAFIASGASLASILVVEIAVKPVVQRERFRFIYALSQVTTLIKTDGTVLTDPTEIQAYFNSINVYGGFHPWWGLVASPNAFKAGNLPFISEDITKSFPSGHATMAAIGFYSLWVLPLTVRAFNTKKRRALCFWIGIFGTAFVGFFRLMAGAHYLSDVLFGSLFAGFFLVLFYFMNTRGNKWLNKYTGISFEKGARAALA